MTQERKDKLLKWFLFTDGVSIDEIKKARMQEIIYLIYTAQRMEKTGSFKDVDFDYKIKKFINSIIEKIIEADEFYIAYNQITKYPHIDDKEKIWIFSEEIYGMIARKHFKKKNLLLNIKKLNNYDLIREIAESTRLGVESLTIDTGQYTIDIKIEDIIPPIDYSGFEEKDIPLINKELSISMIKYFQEVNNENLKYPGKMQNMIILESEMIKQITTGKYLVPVKYKSTDGEKELLENIEFQEIEENDLKWIPIYTDWVEFRKRYDEEYIGAIFDYIEIEKIAGERKLILNIDGLKVKIDNINQAKINNYLRTLEVKKEKIRINNKNKLTPIKIIEPKVYPTEMIKEIIDYMKKNKNIKKAYLKYVIKDDIEHYLMIVDVEKNKDEAFKGIQAIAKGYMKESLLEITEIVSFRENLENTKPFYKKKKFGVF